MVLRLYGCVLLYRAVAVWLLCFVLCCGYMLRDMFMLNVVYCVLGAVYSVLSNGLCDSCMLKVVLCVASCVLCAVS